MYRALVTGGSGFIGSHLVEALIQKGYHVKVFDLVSPDKAHNLKDIIKKSNLIYVSGDITKKEDLEGVVTPDLDVIYHLSAVVGVNKYIDNPLGVIDVNVIGTKNILELASINGTKVLFTSTSEVYGKNPKIPWKEEDSRVLGPTTIDRWSYSTSKAIGEHMVLSMYKYRSLPVSIVRYFNIYGPRQEPILVISQNVKRVLDGKKPIIYDGGKQTRCFTFINDAVAATIKVAESNKTNGEIYNIGSDVESTIKEALNHICHISKVIPVFKEINTTKHYGSSYEDIDRRVPNVSKIKEDLGWEATTKLEDGIKITLNWAKLNRET